MKSSRQPPLRPLTLSSVKSSSRSSSSHPQRLSLGSRNGRPGKFSQRGSCRCGHSRHSNGRCRCRRFVRHRENFRWRSGECSLGKSPTTRVRRLIWLLRVSQAFAVRGFLRCASRGVGLRSLGELGLGLRIAMCCRRDEAPRVGAAILLVGGREFELWLHRVGVLAMLRSVHSLVFLLFGDPQSQRGFHEQGDC